MKKVDILILGAGPAGLSCALYSARSGYSVTLLDPMGPGGQLLFIDEIENYPGHEKTSGYLLSEEMEKQCEKEGVIIEYAKATKIEKDNNTFFVTTDEDETYQAKAVVVATGAKHKKLGLKGEEEYTGKGISYCATCDGPFFKGKTVVVAGGGDTALTDALYLSKLAKNVIIIHRRNQFRAQKVLQDRIKEKENISSIMGRNIVRINGEDGHLSSIELDDGKSINTDGLFIFIGTIPSSEIVKDLVLLENGFIKTSSRMETSLPGLFAAGDVTTTSFRQVVTASSDGAKASHSADEYIQGL